MKRIAFSLVVMLLAGVPLLAGDRPFVCIDGLIVVHIPGSKFFEVIAHPQVFLEAEEQKLPDSFATYNHLSEQFLILSECEGLVLINGTCEKADYGFGFGGDLNWDQSRDSESNGKFDFPWEDVSGEMFVFVQVYEPDREGKMEKFTVSLNHDEEFISFPAIKGMDSLLKDACEAVKKDLPSPQ